MARGLYRKYIITKTNGDLTDPRAQYFVLRVDTDPHAREALKAYRNSLLRSCDNDALAYDIDKLLSPYDIPQNGCFVV